MSRVASFSAIQRNPRLRAREFRELLKTRLAEDGAVNITLFTQEFSRKYGVELHQPFPFLQIAHLSRLGLAGPVYRRPDVKRRSSSDSPTWRGIYRHGQLPVSCVQISRAWHPMADDLIRRFWRHGALMRNAYDIAWRTSLSYQACQRLAGHLIEQGTLRKPRRGFLVLSDEARSFLERERDDIMGA